MSYRPDDRKTVADLIEALHGDSGLSERYVAALAREFAFVIRPPTRGPASGRVLTFSDGSYTCTRGPVKYIAGHDEPNARVAAVGAIEAARAKDRRCAECRGLTAEPMTDGLCPECAASAAASSGVTEAAIEFTGSIFVDDAARDSWMKFFGRTPAEAHARFSKLVQRRNREIHNHKFVGRGPAFVDRRFGSREPGFRASGHLGKEAGRQNSEHCKGERQMKIVGHKYNDRITGQVIAERNGQLQVEWSDWPSQETSSAYRADRVARRSALAREEIHHGRARGAGGRAQQACKEAQGHREKRPDDARPD